MRRGNVVEAVHRVHAVAVQDGAVIAEAGDPALVAFMRSSSKPLQALPAARARDDLDARDLAIASASHLADAAQLEAVRELLAKAPARRRPSSALSGGSNVFRVATCAGPALTIGNAETGSFRARRHASISGSSGTYSP